MPRRCLCGKAAEPAGKRPGEAVDVDVIKASALGALAQTIKPSVQETNASIAPCRICAAAALSIRSARLARLRSASIIARSAAAVDQRSSHNRIGNPRSSILRAKARLDWLRGLSLPSMLMGSPITIPAVGRVASAACNLALSLANLLRTISSAGEAKLHPASQKAVPIVLLPISRPIRTPPSGSASRNSAALVVINAPGISRSSTRHRRGHWPKTADSRKHGNCCRAAHKAPVLADRR